MSRDIQFEAAEEAVLRRIESLPAADALAALNQLAQSFWRAGDEARFAAVFDRAHRYHLTNGRNPLELDETIPAQDLRRTALALLRRGVTYSTVIAALAIAEARLGLESEVRRLVDYDRFFRTGSFTAPSGAEPSHFQDQLADEIKARLEYYGRASGRALNAGWRHNDIMAARTPALTALREALRKEVGLYLSNLPQDEAHPFLASRPVEPRLDGWAVVSGPETHLTSHLHSRAWATGVYYVKQPSVSRDGRTGWLHIGPPTHVGVDESQGWDSRSIEPVAGSFVLMPAYFYHRTEPMGVDDERISIAFEVAHPDTEPRP